MNIEIWSVTRINITRETFFMYIERGVETTPTHPLSCRPLKGHSKSMFVEEYRVGGDTEKRTKTNRGRGEGPSMCVRSLLKKKYKKFYGYSPVFPTDYNGSMKYYTNHHERL